MRPHGCALRKGRYSETGRVYLITTLIERRLPVFADFWRARLLGDSPIARKRAPTG